MLSFHPKFKEEDDHEVFDNAINDKFAPTSTTPLGSTDERDLSLLPSNTLHTPSWSSGSLEALILVGGAH